jgi:hypothetical protein
MGMLFSVFFGATLVLAATPVGVRAQDMARCPSAPTTSQTFAGGYCRRVSANKIAIVFVNGVLGDYWTTWTGTSGKSYWPAMLASDPTFANANIYVHKFVSPKLDTAQKVEELATRLGDYLDTDRVIQDHSQVVFVSHSMGGLIVRALLLQRRFAPGKVPFIYFFGTPSAGANLANVGALVSSNEQFRDMLLFSNSSGSYVEQLAGRWLSSSQDTATGYPRTIWSFCAYEKRGVLGKIVVDELSATFLCNVLPRAVLADHINMVKPDSPTSEAYVYLSAAYRFALSGAGSRVAAALTLAPTTAVVPPFEIEGEGKDKLRLKRETVKRVASNVGCGQRKSDTVEVPIRLEGDERLLTAGVVVGNVDNLSSHAFTIESITAKSVWLKVDVQGFLGPPGTCPAPGGADVLINYVVTH